MTGVDKTLVAVIEICRKRATVMFWSGGGEIMISKLTIPLHEEDDVYYMYYNFAKGTVAPPLQNLSEDDEMGLSVLKRGADPKKEQEQAKRGAEPQKRKEQERRRTEQQK